ncbi:hypothetical protein MCO_01559, partial [Bartonella sp. DB5-6]
MKKNHPSPSSQPNPEALYATVNKPNRGRSTQGAAEETIYA